MTKSTFPTNSMRLADIFSAANLWKDGGNLLLEPCTRFPFEKCDSLSKPSLVESITPLKMKTVEVFRRLKDAENLQIQALSQPSLDQRQSSLQYLGKVGQEFLLL